jgi:phosphoenolpyruvate carboxylase
MGLTNSREAQTVTKQLKEEIRFWWRTDELHQFKPTVVNEVDYRPTTSMKFSLIPYLS